MHLLLPLLALLAAPTAPPQDAYSIRHWTAREGLPQVTVNAIEQTSDGYLWVGTFGGLCRFDGREFVAFSTNEHSALTSNRILALETTSDGRLWIGMQNGGLAAYDGSEFRTVDAIPRADSVTQLVEDSLGNLWVATLDGIWIFRQDRAELLVADLADTPYLSEVSPGRMLCAYFGFFYLDSEGQREPAFEDLQHRINEAVLLGDDLWYLDGTGLNRRNKDGTLELIQGYDTTASFALLVDRSERLWLGSALGLHYWDGSALRDPLLGLGPPVHLYSRSQHIHEDSEGNIWIGGPTGLSRLRPSPISVYCPPYERPLSVSQVALMEHEVIALNPLAPFRFDGQGEFEPLAERISLLGPRTGAELWAVDNRNRIGTWNGKAFAALDLPPLPSTAADWIQAADGTHWLAGSFGLARLLDGELTFWSQPEGLALGPARSLLESRDGSIWVGTSGGLSRFDGTQMQTWLGGMDIPQGMVRTLFEDERGALWIGTYGGGFARWMNGEFRRVHFPDLHISSFSREAPGSDTVLVLGNRALWRTSLSDMHRVADGLLPELHTERMDEGPGITALEAEGMRGQANVLDRDGVHWFSTVEGLLRYDPRSRIPLPPSPSAYVTAVELSGELHRGNHPLRFGPERRGVTFHFTAPTFTSLDTVNFWYRLVGHDEDWLLSRGDRHALYSSLAPGTYTFEVRAQRTGAEPGPVGRSTRLTALPFWYETITFWMALAFTGFALVCAYVRTRVRRESIRAERLEHEVSARTKDLLEIQASLEEKVQERTQQLETDMQRRESLTRELEQAKRFHTIGRLAGGVAHDFNNTLAVITCESHVLLSNIAKGRDKPEITRGSLERVQRATSHAARLTRQLLAYSGRQMVQAQSLEPNAVIGELEVLLRRLLRASIEFRVELGEKVSPVYMDPGQLEQVVMNLVLNARDSIESNGKIVLSTHNVPTAEADGPDHWVELRVEDSGRGIPAENLDQIFEPFFTTRRAEGGTGLGLASVHGILHQIQGKIQVESEPGQGSCFRVRLPAHLNTSEPVGVQDPVAYEGGGPAHIVVVEDQETLGKAVRLLLIEMGHRVTLFQRPQDALLELARNPAVDLLLTDVVMPGMNGLELFRKAKAGRPDLRVLFVTGYALDPKVSEELGSGAYPVLEKPYHPERLSREVQRAMRGAAFSTGS